MTHFFIGIATGFYDLIRPILAYDIYEATVMSV